VKKSSPKPVLPPCMLAHQLLNRLTVIIGNCDLVIERTPADSEWAKLLFVIRENARAMAEDLSRHQGELDNPLHTGQRGACAVHGIV